MILRCPSRLFGVVEGERLEVKCRSTHCGAGKGVVVLHYFSVKTSELIETKKFREPTEMFKPTNEEVRAECP